MTCPGPPSFSFAKTTPRSSGLELCPRLTPCQEEGATPPWRGPLVQCAQAPTAGGRWQGGLLQPPNRTLVSLPLCARPALAEAGERGPDAVLTRGGQCSVLACEGPRALPTWQLWRGPGGPLHAKHSPGPGPPAAPLGQDLNQPESQAGIGVLPCSPTSRGCPP